MERNPRNRGRVIDTIPVSRAGHSHTMEVRFKPDYSDPANMFYVRCEEFGLESNGSDVGKLVNDMRQAILERMAGVWSVKIVIELSLDPEDRISSSFRSATIVGQSIGFGYAVVDWLEDNDGKFLGFRERGRKRTSRSLRRREQRMVEPIQVEPMELGRIKQSYSDSTRVQHRILLDHTPELEKQCESFKERLTAFGDALSTFMTVEKFRKMLDRAGPLALEHKLPTKKGKG